MTNFEVVSLAAFSVLITAFLYRKLFLKGGVAQTADSHAVPQTNDPNLLKIINHIQATHSNLTSILENERNVLLQELDFCTYQAENEVKHSTRHWFENDYSEIQILLKEQVQAHLGNSLKPEYDLGNFWSSFAFPEVQKLLIGRYQGFLTDWSEHITKRFIQKGIPNQFVKMEADSSHKEGYMDKIKENSKWATFLKPSLDAYGRPTVAEVPIEPINVPTTYSNHKEMFMKFDGQVSTKIRCMYYIPDCDSAATLETQIMESIRHSSQVAYNAIENDFDKAQLRLTEAKNQLLKLVVKDQANPCFRSAGSIHEVLWGAARGNIKQTNPLSLVKAA